MLSKTSKRLKRIHRLVDNELPPQEKALTERELADQEELSATRQRIEGIGEMLREASRVPLNAERSQRFMQTLRQRTRRVSPTSRLAASAWNLWEDLAFPIWKPALALGVLIGVLFVPVSGLLLGPEIGSGGNGTATVETDIPQARILILAGSEEGSDHVWVLASSS